MHGKKVVYCIKPCIKQLPVTETYVYLPDTTGCHLDFIEYSGRTTSISSFQCSLIKALKKCDPNTLSEGIECYGEDDMPDADWEEWEEYPPNPKP